ncbi:MAG: hypothetical protein U5K29_04450 [Acidimicrobiales bacterium]|nr:hypothetical protein [Acidimicrobiales bacterium]
MIRERYLIGVLPAAAIVVALAITSIPVAHGPSRSRIDRGV